VCWDAKDSSCALTDIAVLVNVLLT
jgi:hypothetical protein